MAPDWQWVSQRIIFSDDDEEQEEECNRGTITAEHVYANTGNVPGKANSHTESVLVRKKETNAA